MITLFITLSLPFLGSSKYNYLDSPPLPLGWVLGSDQLFHHIDGRKSSTHPLFYEQRINRNISRLRGFKRAFNDANNWHFAMMNDRARNDAYFRALKVAIVPNQSVVLDIGTGSSGLLAMMAARLGARRVFTVERNEVLSAVARETMFRNGFTDVESFVCSSFDLIVEGEGNDGRGKCGVLSERATVLVSEVFVTSIP